MVQTAHTAIANARSHIDQRLARWILMAHDRTRDKNLPLTHEFCLGELHSEMKETVSDPPRHARLHRLHRAGHDFLIIVREGPAVI